MIVLALAGAHDEVARDVLAAAARTGFETLRVGEEELASLLLRWELPETGKPAYLVAGDRQIGVAELAGVLVRRLPGAGMKTAGESDEDYLQIEWRAALLGFLRALPCPVVNRPKPMDTFRQPMLAAHAATIRHAGLRLPHMIVSVAAEDERAFQERHGGRVTRVGLPSADAYPVYLVAAPAGLRRRVLVAGAEAYGVDLPASLARRCVAAVGALDLGFAALTLVSGSEGDTLLELTDTPDWDGCPAGLTVRIAGSLAALLTGAAQAEDVRP